MNAIWGARAARLLLACALFATLLLGSGAVLAAPAPPAPTAEGGQGAGDLYTLNNAADNAVVIYHRAADGALTPIGTAYTQGHGTGAGLGSQGALALARGEEGAWLFAVNAASNDVTVFAVGRDNLTFVQRVATGGVTPISLTYGRGLLYVLDSGSNDITGFRAGEDGRLSPIPGSTKPLSGSNVGGAQIAFAPNSQVLVVTEKATNKIDTYTLDGAGRPSAPIVHDSVGNTPFGFGWSGPNHLIVSDAFGGGASAGAVSSYGVTSAGGVTVISGAFADHQTAPCWVAVTGDGRYAYTTNAGSGTISGYHVDTAGNLSLLNPDGITASTGAGSHPTDMAVSPGSHYLYALLTGATTGIARFQVMPDGSLAGGVVVSTGVTTANAGLVSR